MLKILLDVDGVIVNLDGSYTPYVKHIIPDFSEEKYIVEWNMPQIRDNWPEVYDIIKSLWASKEFMEKVRPFPMALEALEILGKLEKEGKIKILIHTAVANDEIKEVRENYIKKLCGYAQHNFEYDISIGLNKPTYDGFDMIIEDSEPNLKKSTAPYKVIVSRGNNRFTTFFKIRPYKEAFRCESLYSFVTSNTFKDLVNRYSN